MSKRILAKSSCKLCQRRFFFYKRYLFFFITKQTLHLNFSISSNTWVICQKESSSMFGCKLGTVRGCVWKCILFSFFEWIDMRVGMKVMFHSLHQPCSDLFPPERNTRISIRILVENAAAADRGISGNSSGILIRIPADYW